MRRPGGFGRIVGFGRIGGFGRTCVIYFVYTASLSVERQAVRFLWKLEWQFGRYDGLIGWVVFGDDCVAIHGREACVLLGDYHGVNLNGIDDDKRRGRNNECQRNSRKQEAYFQHFSDVRVLSFSCFWETRVFHVKLLKLYRHFGLYK